MTEDKAQRWLGVAGLVFVVLVVISFFLVPNISQTASASKVVSSVHQHKSAFRAAAFVIGLAVIEGVFFFWYLREHLASVAANRALATVGFAGALLFAASGGLRAGFNLALADGIGHLDPGGMQTLNVLSSDVLTFIGGCGVAILLLASGIAIIRHGPLPVWVGWVGVVLGVIGTVIGAPAAALWLLIACIVILVRSGQRAAVGVG
jgi:hypothetical protein